MKRENNDGVFNLTVFKWKGNRNRNEKYPTIMDKLSDLYYFIGKEEEWWKAKIMMVFFVYSEAGEVSGKGKEIKMKNILQSWMNCLDFIIL